MEYVETMMEPVKEGKVYSGKVVRITDFGAFVEIKPGTDGLVHISQLSDKRIPSVSDVVQVGDEILVMVTNVSGDGKIRLSRQAVLEGWTLEEARSNDRPPSRRGRRPRRR
jgi:polyribonucleotide nucleotidyltransferase